MKVLLSGGGTGGHVYPAIAIANKIRDDFCWDGKGNRVRNSS